MLGLMLIGFSLFGLLLAIGAVVLVAQLVRRPIKAALSAAVIGALVALTIGADPGSYAISWGGLALIVAAGLRSRRRRHVASVPKPVMAPPARRVPSPPLPPPPPGPPPALPPVPTLTDIAWDEAGDFVLDGVRVAPARACCDALLELADEQPDDPALAEWADLIRRRVPELVDAAMAAGEGASATERAALAGELADALAEVGAEADARLGARRRAVRDRFDTLRGYVRSRTAPDRDWL